jgi:hypothetical protein
MFYYKKAVQHLLGGQVLNLHYMAMDSELAINQMLIEIYLYFANNLMNTGEYWKCLILLRSMAFLEPQSDEFKTQISKIEYDCCNCITENQYNEKLPACVKC